MTISLYCWLKQLFLCRERVCCSTRWFAHRLELFAVQQNNTIFKFTYPVDFRWAYSKATAPVKKPSKVIFPALEMGLWFGFLNIYFSANSARKRNLLLVVKLPSPIWGKESTSWMTCSTPTVRTGGSRATELSFTVISLAPVIWLVGGPPMDASKSGGISSMQSAFG